MERFIIAAGGTGAMCARAFIYMAAAGCANNDDRYHILLMDKDRDSDAVTACEDLLTNYNVMRMQMGLKPGTVTFPEIKVHKWNFTDEIVDEYVTRTGYAAGTLDSLTLKKLLNPAGNAQMAQILSTMYTQEELNIDLAKGFYGHPNIGAPVFSYVQDRFLATSVTKSDGTVQNNTFMTDLINELTAGKAYVYLMGSLFGGTGATVIPNVVLALRTLHDSAGNPVGETNLVLGGTVVMPYFKLPICPADSTEKLASVAPADSKFAGQTRDALSYYHESGLLNNMMNLLLLGTTNLDVTSELYARGGVQNQHFHIVNLLAASAANRFFKDQLGAMAQAVNVPATQAIAPLGELLVWKADNTNAAVYNTLSAAELDLSNEFQKLNEFLRFSVVVRYYMRLQFDVPLDDMRGFPEIRRTCKQMKRADGSSLDPKTITKNEIDDFYKKPVENAGIICEGFIQFLYDVALSGYDWSGYHNKNKVPTAARNGKQYYDYSVTTTVVPTAAADFGSRWVDLANLTDLKDLLEATNPLEIAEAKSLNGISSFAMLDNGRTGVKETKYPNSIANVYKQTLEALALEGPFWIKKRDDVWFCEIYDELRKRV